MRIVAYYHEETDEHNVTRKSVGLEKRETVVDWGLVLEREARFEICRRDSRIAELEQDLSYFPKTVRSLAEMVTARESEIAQLRAELAALKAQEPVAYIPVDRETGEEWHPVLKKGSGNICDYKPLYAAPVVSAEQQGVADGWVPVSERLPEPFTVVALLDENRWMNTGSDDFEANWTGAGWLNDCSSRPYWAAIGEPRGLVLEAVTHWMPLPAAPAPSTTEGQGDE